MLRCVCLTAEAFLVLNKPCCRLGASPYAPLHPDMILNDTFWRVLTYLFLIWNVERLVKVSRTTAQVHDDLNVTDRLVSGIESFWSAFANKFRFDNSKDNRKAQAKKEDEIDEEMNQDENTIAVARHEHERAEMKAKMRQMTERNAQVKYGVEEIDEYFEETDRDLDELSDVLADIKGASLKMRAGLVRDNKVLDRLEPEAARAEERLRKTNAKIDRLK